MRVGILKPFAGQSRSMLNVYKQILDHNNIEYVEMDINSTEFWNIAKRVDLFLAKIAQTDDDLALACQIIPILTMFMGVKCFPNYPTVWHYDDKVKQYYLLKQAGYPMVESFIYWDKNKAIDWANSIIYPVVFKLKGGAGSINVKKVDRKSEAIRIINMAFGKGIHPYYFDVWGKLAALNYDFIKILKYFGKPVYNRFVLGFNGHSNYTRHKNYVYFQRFMARNDYDTRVTILGHRAFAFKRFVRTNDFRASGSNIYDMNRDNIDMRFVKIAFDISERFGFQSMAYDFIYDENSAPVLIEISYTYGDYPEFSTGFWDPSLEWHEGNYLPEYFELMDALNMPDLVLPDIDLDSPYKKAKMI